MVDESKTHLLLDIIKNLGKEKGSSSKSRKSKKDQNEKLFERLNHIENENKALKFDLNENSRMLDMQVDSFSHEKQKVEDLKKEMNCLNEEEKKNKEGVSSKMSNYKTRIFFLESQVEELEKNIKEIEVEKSKAKSK